MICKILDFSALINYIEEFIKIRVFSCMYTQLKSKKKKKGKNKAKKYID